MGLNIRFLQLMVWLKQQGHISAGQKVIEIGAQQLNNNFLKATDEIALISRLFGVAVPSLPAPIGEGPDHLLDQAAPQARTFYRALGFDYSCVDIDNDPASVALDLNFESVPKALAGKFDLVTNFGTTEHVVNQLNAFKIIHDLAAPNAIMIHELPSHGEINHGLFAYQPKFFDLLARCNEYSTLFLDFSWSDVAYGFSEDLEQHLSRFVDIKSRPRYGSSPSALTAVLRKNNDAAFVPPIDVSLGSTAPNIEMRDRYGIVFRPIPLSRRVVESVRTRIAKARHRRG